MLRRLLEQLDVAPQQAQETCQLIQYGFTAANLITVLFKFRRYDSADVAHLSRAAREFLEFAQTQDVSCLPDRTHKLLGEVGFWNKDLLMQQLRKGKIVTG